MKTKLCISNSNRHEQNARASRGSRFKDFLTVGHQLQAGASRGSLDYLTGKTDLHIDKSLLDKILSIQKLPEGDREHILFALKAMLRDAKARAAYS